MEAISTTIKVKNVGYFLLEERLLSIPFINFIKGFYFIGTKMVKVKTKDTIYAWKSLMPKRFNFTVPH